MNRQDAFVLMPTGGGKSLCFQIPALLMDGLTVVISPLIALMKDQVDALKINGISAAFLNSTLSYKEQADVISRIEKNTLKLLYVAPEKLFLNDLQFIHSLKTQKVSLFAIDEAHCISQWGHDFRPEYLNLKILKQLFPTTPIIALTATADTVTRKDILEKLHLMEPRVFVSSFNRANIHYYVEPKANPYDRMVEYLKKHPDESGIVYALSRQSVERLAEDLEQDGFSAKPYHAGLEKNIRERHQELFIKDQIKIMVATIAFGMGIDKSNVRFVIHMDLPKNIESYYQETGRAGRDGLQSEALLFYGAGDVMKLKKFSEIEDNSAQTRVLLNKLNAMVHFCETRICRRKYLLNYFGESFENHCGTCDVCLSQHEKFDGTIMAQKILSAVSRLHENYGVGFIVDFLCGSKNDKISETQRQLKTYGIGAGITKDEWKRYIRELLALGYLKQEGEYPVLKLTDVSVRLLTGNEPVMLTKSIIRAEAAQTVAKHEEGLIPLLKQLRFRLATESNVPAYVIFSDVTLLELATYLPQTISELKQISGFGEIKLQRYGKPFLDMVQAYCRTNKLSSKIDQKKKKRERASKTGGPADTKLESLKLFREGKSPVEIAAIRTLGVSTIETHLAHFILDGTLGVDDLVPKEKISPIKKAIEEHGSLSLKGLKDTLGEHTSYGEIRAVLNSMQKLKA